MVDRVFRPLFQAAVAILLVVSVAATVLLFGLQGYVYSERLYRDIPNDPAFVQGMTDYVWYNYRVFFVFWLMIGIVSAARRIDYALRCKKPQESDEQNAELTL